MSLKQFSRNSLSSQEQEQPGFVNVRNLDSVAVSMARDERQYLLENHPVKIVSACGIQLSCSQMMTCQASEKISSCF